MRLLVVSSSSTSGNIVELLRSWNHKGLIEPLVVCNISNCRDLAGEAPWIPVRSTHDWDVELDLINASARDAGLVAARGVLLYDSDFDGAGAEQAFGHLIAALLGHLPRRGDRGLLDSGMVSLFAPIDSTTRFDPSAVTRDSSAVVLSVEDRAQPNGGKGVLNSQQAYAGHVAGAVATISGAWRGLDMSELDEVLSKREDHDNFSLACALRHFVRVAGAAPSLTTVVDVAAEAMLGGEPVELVDIGVRKVSDTDAIALVDAAVDRVKAIEHHPISYDRPDTRDVAAHLAGLPEQNRGAASFGWHQTVETLATVATLPRSLAGALTPGKKPSDAHRGGKASAMPLPQRYEQRLLDIEKAHKEAAESESKHAARRESARGMAEALRDALFIEAFALVDGGPPPDSEGGPGDSWNPQPVLADRSLAAPHPQNAPQLSRDLREATTEIRDVPAYDLWHRGGVLHRLEPFRNQRSPAVEADAADDVADQGETSPSTPSVADPSTSELAVTAHIDDEGVPVPVEPEVPEHLPDAAECSGTMYAWSKGLAVRIDEQDLADLDVAPEYHLGHSWYTSQRESFLGKVAHHLGSAIDQAAEDHRASETAPTPPEIADRLRRMRRVFRFAVWCVVLSALVGTALALVLAPSPLAGLQRNWPWLILLYVLLAVVWFVSATRYERKDLRILEEVETYFCDADNQHRLHEISRYEYERLLSVNDEFAPWAEIIGWVINEPQPSVTPSASDGGPPSMFSEGPDRINPGTLPNAVRLARIEMSESFVLREKRSAVERATKRGWLLITFEDVLTAAFPSGEWDFDEAVERVAMGERGSVDAQGFLLHKLRSRALARHLRGALTDRVRQWRGELVPTLRGSELLGMQVVDLDSGQPMQSRQGRKRKNSLAGAKTAGSHRGRKARKQRQLSNASLQAFQAPMIGGQTPFAKSVWTSTRRTAGAHEGRYFDKVSGSLTSVAWALEGLAVQGNGEAVAEHVSVHERELILAGDDIVAVAARVDVAQLEPPEGFICFSEREPEHLNGNGDDGAGIGGDDDDGDTDNGGGGGGGGGGAEADGDEL